MTHTGILIHDATGYSVSEMGDTISGIASQILLRISCDDCRVASGLSSAVHLCGRTCTSLRPQLCVHGGACMLGRRQACLLGRRQTNSQRGPSEGGASPRTEAVNLSIRAGARQPDVGQTRPQVPGVRPCSVLEARPMLPEYSRRAMQLKNRMLR